MITDNINWADVYSSLGIKSLKTAGLWMFIVTLLAGLVIVVIFFLLFRREWVVIAFIAAGALIFSGKYAVGLLKLSKNPKVYSGVVTGKIENSYTEESTKTRYFSHRIRLSADLGSELTENGLGEIKRFNYKKIRINCSKEIFNTLNEGDDLTLVVMPHDKSIGWLHVNNLK